MLKYDNNAFLVELNLLIRKNDKNTRKPREQKRQKVKITHF